jgi:hypothetical protein
MRGMSDEVERAYATLGLAPGASPDEIKARYKALVRKWHPDRYESDPAGQAEAAQQMRTINHAYQVLEDTAPDPSPARRPEGRHEEVGQPPAPAHRTPLKSVWEDTIGDKISRFCLGALIGAPLACRSWQLFSPQNDLQGWGIIIGTALAFGTVGVVFGWRVFEWLVRSRW